jgi:hypothetical protein
VFTEPLASKGISASFRCHSVFQASCHNTELARASYVRECRNAVPVGIATNYAPAGRGVGARFPAGAWDMSVVESVQTGFEAHSASYGGSFRPGVKYSGCLS